MSDSFGSSFNDDGSRRSVFGHTDGATLRLLDEYHHYRSRAEELARDLEAARSDLDAARREVAELLDDKGRLEDSVNNYSTEVDFLRVDLEAARGELELVRSECSCDESASVVRARAAVLGGWAVDRELVSPLVNLARLSRARVDVLSLVVAVGDSAAALAAVDDERRSLYGLIVDRFDSRGFDVDSPLRVALEKCVSVASDDDFEAAVNFLVGRQISLSA